MSDALLTASLDVRDAVSRRLVATKQTAELEVGERTLRIENELRQKSETCTKINLNFGCFSLFLFICSSFSFLKMSFPFFEGLLARFGVQALVAKYDVDGDGVLSDAEECAQNLECSKSILILRNGSQIKT